MSLLKLFLEINKIGKEIEKMQNYEELGYFLYHKLKNIIDFDFLSLGRIDEDEMKLKYYFYVENGIVTSKFEIPVAKENSLSYYSHLNKRIILMNDVEKEYKNYVKSLSHLGGHYKDYSLLTIPIFDNDKVKAILSVQHWRKNAFDVEKVVLFKEIANYLSNVLWKFENKTSSNIKQNAIESSKSLIGSFIDRTSKADTISNLNKILLEFCQPIFSIENFIMSIYSDSGIEKFLIKTTEHHEVEEVSLPKDYPSSNYLYYLNNENKDFASLDFGREILDKKETFNIIINIYKINFIKILEKQELVKEIQENQNMLTILKKGYDNFRALNELGQNIVASSSIREVCFLIYESLKTILAKELSIIIVKKEKNLLNYTCVENNEEINMEPLDMDNDSSLSSFTIKNNKIIVINDYDQDIFIYYKDNSQAKRNVVGKASNSIIYLPLLENKTIIGAFSVQADTKNFFDNYTIELVKNIASFVSVALSHENRRENLSNEIALVKKDHLSLQQENIELEKISSTDSLTNLSNRREFERQVQELIKHKKSKINIFMSLIDLDYFKHVNDTYGHLEGDKYLIEISNIFKSFQNENIVFSRYGGDEFVAFFHNKTKEEVDSILRTILKKLKNVYLPNPYTKHNQTLTIGVANMLDLKDNSYKELYRRADNALYLGKNKGRNQIIFI